MSQLLFPVTLERGGSERAAAGCVGSDHDANEDFSGKWAVQDSTRATREFSSCVLESSSWGVDDGFRVELLLDNYSIALVM